jgi:hypothetical protein
VETYPTLCSADGFSMSCFTDDVINFWHFAQLFRHLQSQHAAPSAFATGRSTSTQQTWCALKPFAIFWHPTLPNEEKSSTDGVNFGRINADEGAEAASGNFVFVQGGTFTWSVCRSRRIGWRSGGDLGKQPANVRSDVSTLTYLTSGESHFDEGVYWE